MTVAAGNPGSNAGSPNWSTRLMGAGVWLLLMVTIVGSAFLIQRFVAEDVLEQRVKLSDRLQTAEVLISQGGDVQIAQAVRTLEGVLEDHPLDPDAVLLLEQARGMAVEGTSAQAKIHALIDGVRDSLRRRIAKSDGDAQSRFLLARLIRPAFDPAVYREEARRLNAEAQEKTGTEAEELRSQAKRRLEEIAKAEARRAEADKLLAEARTLLEARLRNDGGDREASFLLARVLRSRPDFGGEDFREFAKLVRASGRPESELRLNNAGRVPLEQTLELAARALDEGLFEDVERHLTTVLAEAPDNVRARFLWAEFQLLGRPDSDARILPDNPQRITPDENHLIRLRQVCDAPKAPQRAEIYLAALEAMGDEKERAQARTRYGRAGAGFDILAEAEKLVRKRSGNARLLLTAETLLGKPGSRTHTLAAARRIELVLNEVRGGLQPLKPEEAAEVADRLHGILAAGKPEDVPARMAVYLAAVEPLHGESPASHAADHYREAVRRGFDVSAEVEALGKAEMHGAARWLLKAAAERGFGLTHFWQRLANPAVGDRDSELWYQLGRTYATGRNSDFQTAAIYYRVAVEAGAARKAKGAGKAALSWARVYANDKNPQILEEARRMVELAEACGVQKMDITSTAKVRDTIDRSFNNLNPTRAGTKVAPH